MKTDLKYNMDSDRDSGRDSDRDSDAFTHFTLRGELARGAKDYIQTELRAQLKSYQQKVDSLEARLERLEERATFASRERKPRSSHTAKPRVPSRPAWDPTSPKERLDFLTCHIIHQRPITFRRVQGESMYLSERPLSKHECASLLHSINSSSLSFSQAEEVVKALSDYVMIKALQLGAQDVTELPYMSLPSQYTLRSEGITNAHHGESTSSRNRVYLVLNGDYISWLRDIVLTQ